MVNCFQVFQIVPLKFLSLAFAAIVLTTSLYFTLFWNLGNHSVGHYDESIYIELVQRMKLSGEWWTPKSPGGDIFDKPPFKLWVSAAVLSLFEESNFTHRIVDASAGVLTSLAICFFAKQLFSSWLAGLFSALTLLSAKLFVVEHGARSAMQDSMLVFLTTLSMIFGWHFINALRESSNKRNLNAFAFALCVGLAVLTKNVIGFLPLIMLGIYLLIGENRALIWKNRFPLSLTALAAITIPACWFLPQLLGTPLAYEILINRTLLERATTGYHNVHNPWYYWEWFVERRAGVPLSLLLPATAWAVYQWLTSRSLERLNAFFLLLWAYFPILFFQLSSSKLFWYLAPAIPGMAILIGGLFSSALKFLCKQENFSFSSTLTGLFILYAPFSLGFYLIGEVVLQHVARETTRTPLDLFAETTPSIPVGIYKSGPLTNTDLIYARMTGPTEKIENKKKLETFIQQKREAALLTHPRHASEIYNLRPFRSYQLIPPKWNRKIWLLLLHFGDKESPHLSPTSRLIPLGRPGAIPLYGFEGPKNYRGKLIRKITAPRAALQITGDTLMHEFKTMTSITMRPTFERRLEVSGCKVFVNEKLVAQIYFSKMGYHDYEFTIPPGTWMKGKNALSFTPIAKSKTPLDKNSPSIALEKIRMNIGRQ